MTNYSQIARQGRVTALTLLHERKRGASQSAPLERPCEVVGANLNPKPAHLAFRFGRAVVS